MTPVQLPEVPEPFIELMTHTVYDAWVAQLREYATEAVMAERRRLTILAAEAAMWSFATAGKPELTFAARMATFSAYLEAGAITPSETNT